MKENKIQAELLQRSFDEHTPDTTAKNLMIYRRHFLLSVTQEPQRRSFVEQQQLVSNYFDQFQTFCLFQLLSFSLFYKTVNIFRFWTVNGTKQAN